MLTLAVLIAVGAIGVSFYNRFIRLRNGAESAWSDVDVQLKRRHDLVPNLVETVKGYAAHERGTLERVVQARNQALGAAGAAERVAAENALSAALRQLFALAEAYPDLKANASFLQLQSDLGRIEETIANARRYYNAVVRDFNTGQQTFPANLIAGVLGFGQRPFFEAEAPERAAVAVQF